MTEQTLEPATRQQQILDLYRIAFPNVAFFVRKMGGSQEEAKDIFHDALLIYYEKKAERDFCAGSSEEAYVAGIARHLWYRLYKKQRLAVPLAPDLGLAAEGEKNVSPQLLSYVERTGKKCLELLSAFYYEQLSMRELAARFGFAGERSATAQKYKCLQKVRDTIHRQALTKEDFYE